MLQFNSSKCSFHLVIAFVCEQLELLTMKKKNYSYQFLIFSSIFYNVSPHAYRFLRNSGNLIFPCYSTIHKLTLANSMNPFHEQSDNTFLFYINQKFKALSPSDATVSLLIDEIHLKPFFDYKGGTIAGVAFNSSEAAKSAFVFMISSVFSACKDVVHVLPAYKMSAKALYDFIRRTVTGLESIGFRVISVITDNNSINSKAMSYFASPPQRSIVYPHPSDKSRPLFFILDSVHILKCIRNNWLNQKTEGKCLSFPVFQYDNIASTNTADLPFASFESLKQLHHMESENTLKFGYKLSVKALQPSSLQRQNVKLVLQIFNDFVSQSLLSLGDKFNIPHYQDTSAFIKIITTWWQIVNVKTPKKGRRLNSKYQQPLLSEDTDTKLFLRYFIEWLSRWGRVKSSHGSLTSETFYALHHTTNALLEIADYCISELGANYVLLGKFQTDCLEARFGQYRQLSGGKYDVSLRQICECEKKIRLLSVLKLKLSGIDVTISDFTIDWNQLDDLDSQSEMNISVSNEDVQAALDYLPVITYVAGYCSYSINKKMKCEECKDRMVSASTDESKFENSLIKGISRGSLLYPSSDMVHIVLISYIVIEKITKCEQFLRAPSQRALAVNTILIALDNDEITLSDVLNCNSGHDPSKIIKMTAYICANVLLNNYCFMKNDTICSSKLAKRRKMQTLL